MKTCPRCHEEKPPEQFYKSAKRPDGLSSYCRQCQITDAKSRYIEHPRWRAPEGQKYCPACQEVKPLDTFGANKSQHDGKQSRCKPCCVASVTASRQKNPEAHRRSSKNWRDKNPERHADNHARWMYGVPHGTYAVMLEKQGGRCAICETADTGKLKRFHIDHCHDTRTVRGLLCGPCNIGIGQMKHDLKIIRAAASYLEKPQPG